MRKIILIALSLLMLVPCEMSAGIGSHEKKSKAQKYAEKKSKDTMRAWGRYEGFSSMDLEGFAAAVAREKLAVSVGNYVKSIVEKYQDAVDSDAYNKKGKAVNDGESQQRLSSKLEIVADAFIRNSWVVMSDRYVRKDGTVVCFAAVEVGVDDVEEGVMTSKILLEALEEAGIDVNSQEFASARENTKKRYAEGKLDLSKKIDLSTL